jgi:hypothetical protein
MPRVRRPWNHSRHGTDVPETGAATTTGTLPFGEKDVLETRGDKHLNSSAEEVAAELKRLEALPTYDPNLPGRFFS